MKRLFLLVGLFFALLGSAFAVVNINTATKDQFDSLKGIGPVKAQAIIDYRTKNGPFKSVDDLTKVNGIGPKTLEDIRKELSVSGSTTAAKPAAATAAAPAKSADGKAAAAPQPAKAVEPAKSATPATSAKAAEPAKRAPPAVAGKQTESAKNAAPSKAAVPAASDTKKDAAKSDQKASATGKAPDEKGQKDGKKSDAK